VEASRSNRSANATFRAASTWPHRAGESLPITRSITASWIVAKLMHEMTELFNSPVAFPSGVATSTSTEAGSLACVSLLVIRATTRLDRRAL
jgi:hypothetical protein